VIENCSEDLQVYIAEHLRAFVNTHSEIENTIKEEYVAVVIKWIIESSITLDARENFSMELYNYIFELIHDQRFPRVQKTVVNAFNSVFFHQDIKKENVFLQDDAITKLERMICSWDTYSEDIVAVCLLAFGNCLLRLQKFQISRVVSDEMKNIFSNLFERSSSEIVSMRAKICLIFTEISYLKFSTISNWLINKWNMTSKERYKVLFQLTLYEQPHILKNESRIVELIETHFVELIDIFVTDLYNYLSSTDDSNYLADPIPNCAKTAANLCREKSNEFCDAVRKSSFGEKEFKTKLSLHFKRNLKGRDAVIELYSGFSIVTIELLDMLEDIDWPVSTPVEHLNQVSGRDVTDKLFQLIDLTTSEEKLNNFLHILQLLVQVDAISLLEVYQRILSIKNVPYNDDVRRLNRERIILHLLQNLSCFEVFSWGSENFFTEGDIEEEFEREIC
jgi:serine/threonine protein kinase